MNEKIAIIGGGNLGLAIANGLVEGRYTTAANIHITKRNTGSLKSKLPEGVHLSADNTVVKDCSWIIIAVKPYQVQDVIDGIRDVITPDKKIISVVSGVTLERLEELLGNDYPIFRAMPNTAVSIRQSMTCISHNTKAAANKKDVVKMFEHLGKAILIDDGLMNAATVLGACGIAYVMRFIRANIQGGIQIGFDAATAAAIVQQTVKGAAELLMQNSTHPEEEIDKVTTPRGCTIPGLNEMEHQGFSSSLIKGIVTSYQSIG